MSTRRMDINRHHRRNRSSEINPSIQRRNVPAIVKASKMELGLAKDEGAFEKATEGLEPATGDCLLGKDVKYRNVMSPIERCIFWSDNTRLHNFCGERFTSQKEIFAALCEREHDLPLLTAQIGDNGGFPDPLIAVPTDDGKLEVSEGARRLAAAKILSGIEEVPNHWPKPVKKEIEELIAKKQFPKMVPVKVYDEITSHQLQARLAIDHISGKKQWSALRRSYFGFQMLAERSKINLECTGVDDLRRVWHELESKDQDVFKEVAETLGYRNRNIANFRFALMAYIANGVFCKLYDNKRVCHNVFRQFYRRPWWRDMADGVQPMMRVGEKGSKEKRHVMWPDREIESKLMHWLAAGHLKDGDMLDHLPGILDNEETRKVFEKEGFDKAYDLLSKTKEEAAEADQYSPTELLDFAIEDVQELDLHLLRSDEGAEARKKLTELRTAISELEKELAKAG